MLKDTKQSIQETCKIIEVTAGVPWEVSADTASSQQHQGSGCVFIGEEVDSSSALAGHISPIKSMQMLLVLLFSLFTLDFTYYPIYLVFGLEKMISCYSCISRTMDEHEDQETKTS